MEREIKIDQVKFYPDGYDIYWSVEGFGFGTLSLNKDLEIIDDENMGKEFCEEVIKLSEAFIYGPTFEITD